MDRNDPRADKRRFKRIMFTAADEVAGLVQAPNDVELTLKIADISAGGLRFILPRDTSVGILPGCQLSLLCIQGQLQLKFLPRIKLAVRWLIDEPQFAHVMIGCEFIEHSENIRKQIEIFVAAETENNR